MGCGSSAASVSPAMVEWPVKNRDGNYVAHKRNGRWINYWHKDK